MGQIVRIIVLFIFLTLKNSACAENSIVDQRVRSSFQPWNAFLFSSSTPGTVKNSPAVVVPGEAGEFLVGAYLDPSLRSSNFFYTFFLRGKEGAFAATPVRKDSDKDAAVTDRADYETEALLSDEKRSKADQALSKLQNDLKELRARATRVSGVDDIVQLQTEINRLENSSEQRASEQSRLRELIEAGRKLSDSPGIDILRQKLSEDLRDTAQVTAMADRLKARKKQAAKETLDEKLALVKEMGKFNREEIAREILALRSKRKGLESKIGAAEEEAE